MGTFEPLPLGDPNVRIVNPQVHPPPEPRERLETKTLADPVHVPDAAPDTHFIPGEVPGIQEEAPLGQASESHALAQADAEEKGAAQESHGNPEARDVGWNENPDNVPELVGGLPNEELWTLIRRFNKQLYHVKTIPYKPLGGLDLNIADKEEFSPDKMRSNIERLYMTVIVGVMTFVKHVTRIQSWNEKRRTTMFCTAYFVAWLLDMLMPSFLLFLIALITLPRSRSFFFPHAPLALVDAKTGNLQKPSAGVLASHDSLTGAPEKHKGEAVEQEAANFVNGFANIAVSSATGQHSDNGNHGEEGAMDTTAPDPTKMIAAASDAKVSAAAGDKTPVQHDKTKEPIENKIWEKARPATHAVADIADTWERFANALSPTPPFPPNAYRLRFAGILLPLLAMSLVLPPGVLYKTSSFIGGAAFFSKPMIVRGMEWLNLNYPKWQKLLELRNSVLKGVPTNAQLTLTLLRVGEVNKAPLPPPPSSDKPPSETAQLPDEQVAADLNASPEEVKEIATKDLSAAPPTEEKKPKHKGRRVIGLLKGVTSTGISAVLGTDQIKAKAGSIPARDRLGVLSNVSKREPKGPVEFRARLHGKRGVLYLITAAATPCISYVSENAIKKDESAPSEFSIPINDIAELKKIGGLGWKVKLVVGWAMQRQVADGLQIVDKAGHSHKLTAIHLREELFNRLIALGQQNWEML